MYSIQKKKANVYHQLERRRQSKMASARDIRAKSQELKKVLRKYQTWLEAVPTLRFKDIGHSC